VAVVLSATDADGNPLTYSIVNGPAKGSLSGSAPNLTYTPAADLSGADSFTYKANDGSADSNIATVSITISSVNDAPAASSKSASTRQDTAVSIGLAASDKEGNALSYTIVSGPSNGSLSGTAPNLSYMPALGFSGVDSFTYKANDGAADSNTATVSITVEKITVTDDSLVLPRTGWTLKFVDSEDAASYPAVKAFDGNPNTFWHTRWLGGATPPPHEIQINLGKLCTLQGFRYLPRQDGFPVGNIGQYQFFTSLDGKTWGGPVASGTFANNADKKEVSFPATAARFVRLRSLTDASGSTHCNVAELDVLGTLVPNRAPTALPKTVSTFQETPLAIQLAGNDEDGDALNYAIVTGPSHGTLTGTPPSVTYTPAAGYSGGDTFTYQANDGTVSSSAATVSITVEPQDAGSSNHPPAFAANPIVLQAGVAGKPYPSFTIAATDPDAGDTITHTIVSGPDWLGISPSGKLTGTPPDGAAGANRFTVRATDQADAFAETELVIDIAAADLPLPWEFGAIGGTARKSGADYKTGVFTLEGSGNLTGAADSGTFVWQTLSGDGEIVARIGNLEDAAKTARAGLMIRDSLAAGSRHVFIGVNGAGDFRWVRRARTGGQAVMKTAGSGTVPNAWLRLTRKGFMVTVFKSANGSDWSRVASVPADFGSNCYIGLFLSSGGTGSASGSFRGVKVDP